MVAKQLENLGCPSWTTDINEELDPSSLATTSPLTLRIFAYVSDQGSDQARLRKVMAVDTSRQPLTLYIDMDCAMHNCHLIEKGSNYLIDARLGALNKKFKLFNTLAKVCNLWRDSVRAIFAQWASLHGSEAACRHAGILPPRCLSGRWGSAFGMKAILNQAGQDQVSSVFHSVFDRKSGRPKKQEDDNEEPIIDLCVDAQRAYQVQSSRWAREAVNALDDAVFWIASQLSERCGGPLSGPGGLLRFLEHQFTAEEMVKGGSHLLRLVTKEADALSEKYVALLAGDAVWLQELLTLAALQTASTPILEADLLEFWVALTLYHASSLHRRLVQPTKRCSCGFELMGNTHLVN